VTPLGSATSKPSPRLRVGAALVAVGSWLLLLSPPGATAAKASRPVIASVTVSAAGGVHPVPNGRRILLDVRVSGARTCTFWAQNAPDSGLFFVRTFACLSGYVRALMPPAENFSARRVTLRYLLRAHGPGGTVEKQVAVIVAAKQPLVPSNPQAAATPPATASLSISPASLPSTGGQVAFTFASTNATSCELSSTPAFWNGSSGLAVSCNGAVTEAVPPSTEPQQWTFVLTATNNYGQSATSSQTLTEAAPEQQPTPPALGIDYVENWAGYDISGDSFAAVAGTFNVPTLYAATKHATSSEWVGIDGAANDSLIQAGVAQKYDPSTGLVYDHAWWEILPAAETVVPLRISTGDEISIAITQIAGTHWRISITNETTRRAFVTNQTYLGPLESAEWIVEAPTSGATGAVETLGGFTPNVTFANAAYEGNATTLTEDVMVQDGVIVATPSPISRNAFVVGYGATAPDPPGLAFTGRR
jgi:Peptidase A4 family